MTRNFFHFFEGFLFFPPPPSAADLLFTFNMANAAIERTKESVTYYQIFSLTDVTIYTFASFNLRRGRQTIVALDALAEIISAKSS